MNEVGWIVDLDILPDQVDAFYALTLEMINAAHSEPGCLSYERFFTGDRRKCRIFERYESSEAALHHLGSFREAFGPRYEQMVNRRSFWIFGQPSRALAEELNRFSSELHPHVVGFHD